LYPVIYIYSCFTYMIDQVSDDCKQLPDKQHDICLSNGKWALLQLSIVSKYCFGCFGKQHGGLRSCLCRVYIPGGDAQLTEVLLYHATAANNDQVKLWGRCAPQQFVAFKCNFGLHCIAEATSNTALLVMLMDHAIRPVQSQLWPTPNTFILAGIFGPESGCSKLQQAAANP